MSIWERMPGTNKSSGEGADCQSKNDLMFWPYFDEVLCFGIPMDKDELPDCFVQAVDQAIPCWNYPNSTYGGKQEFNGEMTDMWESKFLIDQTDDRNKLIGYMALVYRWYFINGSKCVHFGKGHTFYGTKHSHKN
eukprot:104536_1